MTMLRAATPSDVTRMGDILQDWIEATPWMPVLHTREGTHRFVGRLQQTTEVTVVGDVPVDGFLSLEGQEVEALYLAQGTCGKGSGAALLHAAQAARPRLALWTFQQNAGARRFYARHGFREVKLTDGTNNDEKLPDVRLEWSRE